MRQQAIRNICDVCQKETKWVLTEDYKPDHKEFKQWRTYTLSMLQINRPDPMDFCSKECLHKHIDDIYNEDN